MAQPTWVTPARNFGTYAEEVAISKTFVATPSNISNTLQYNILNGTFPATSVPFVLNATTGVLTGTPSQVAVTTDFSFTIRVKEYSGPTLIGFTDRTFSFSVTGVSPPSFVTPAGPLYPAPVYLPDSTWNPYQILVDNPDPGSNSIIRLVNGSLPDGLEINTAGLIRGYAEPANSNYSFTLSVDSKSGSATRNFSIRVVQQTAMTRAPAILNTRPPRFIPEDNDPNYPYYLNSDGDIGVLSQDNYFIFKIIGESFNSGSISYSRTGTLPPGVYDNINFSSNNTIITIINSGTGYAPGDQLKINGSTLGGVDGINDLLFEVATVSAGGITSVTSISGLNVDSAEFFALLSVITVTGSGSSAVINVAKNNPSWLFGTITDNPSLLVETYNFSYVAHNNNNGLSSTPANFTVTVVAQTNNIPFDTTVTWLTEPDLGTIFNGEISSLAVEAKSAGGLELEYTLVSGSLPPDVILSKTGELLGRIAFETENTLTPKGTSIDYTFTVQAENTTYSEISTTRTFTLTVYQNFDEPYDNIYIKALMEKSDRMKLNSLLQDQYIFPPEYIYRLNDVYFGKADSIVYQHMFGVPSSTVETYIAAVDRNHYRRNITLGPIKTAIARDDAGNVQYEIVYSEIIDNLVNADGVSINKQIIWPVPIDGFKPRLYPNSLPNMRKQIATFIGQDTQSSILPSWMTTQQENGDILGFIPVWVICYTKPGYSQMIKNNIVSPLSGPVIVSKSSSEDNTLECISTEGFFTGMKIKFSGSVFGGVTAGMQYYVYSIVSEKHFQISTSMSTPPVALTNASGTMFMEHIVWNYKLNELEFKIDRFEVSKSITFDYNPTTSTWDTLPSGVTSTNDNDEYIYFKKNILGGY